MERPWRNAAFWLVTNSFLNLLSYSTQDHQPRGDTTCSKLDPPPSVISPENAPHACPQASMVRALFPVEIPSSEVTLASVTDSQHTDVPS